MVQAVHAQWDVQFTDFTTLRAYYNPAVSGTDGLLDVSIAYSMQMVGYDGAPKTCMQEPTAYLFLRSYAMEPDSVFIAMKSASLRPQSWHSNMHST